MKAKTQDEIPIGFTGTIQKTNGSKYWYKEDKLHREDGPAIEFANGRKEWWVNGELHREEGPAIEFANGSYSWYIEDYNYSANELQSLIEASIFLGKEKSKYNLDWLRFLTNQGIKEFPFIPGMEEDEEFKPFFNQLFGTPSKP